MFLSKNLVLYFTRNESYSISMAAIISRITREKRERESKSLHQIKSSHCPYLLETFKQNYKPEVDNKVSHPTYRVLTFYNYILHIF